MRDYAAAELQRLWEAAELRCCTHRADAADQAAIGATVAIQCCYRRYRARLSYIQHHISEETGRLWRRAEALLVAQRAEVEAAAAEAEVAKEQQEQQEERRRRRQEREQEQQDQLELRQRLAFAPSVLREKASEYFEMELDQESPYMLLVAQVQSADR